MPPGISPRVFVPALCLVIVTGLFSGAMCRVFAGTTRPVADQYRVRVINIFPHDPDAFTQGFTCHDGFFYEGTGLRGRSSLRRCLPVDGEIQLRHDLSPEFFGEGITIIGDRIVQLTYLQGRGFIYDLETFAPLGEFSYAGQGWGLTNDGERLIMSNGTATLVFLDAKNFEPRGQVRAFDDAGPVGRLNELEFIDGEVWANVWGEDRIARIDPRTGRVVAWVDLQGLGGQRAPGNMEKVLNGIAWDAEDGRLFVTGKFWTEIYEVEVVAVGSPGAVAH